jgi:hypothetical protein
MISSKPQQKMMCIKFTNGTIFRVSQILAKAEVLAGKAVYTTKSALHSFWKRQAKLESNEKALKSFDFSKNQEANFLYQEENGKTFAYLKRGKKRRIEKVPPKETIRKKKWWEKALETITLGAFKPNIVVMEGGKLQIVSYPTYQRFYVGMAS